jgi:hypothetical protein
MKQSDYSVNCFFDGGSNKSFNGLICFDQKRTRPPG